ncbi:thiolase family protein [Hoeflea sp.]|uniref:thiolase family protein n=1 Tax=Hoeflea sp. TaxID=1940281 RepID=UPI003B01A0FD
MTDVHIAGIAMTKLGKFVDRTVKDLTGEVVDGVLKDAGLERKDLQAAWFSNTRQALMEGQNSIRGQVALRAAGIDGIPIVNVENACASSSTGFNQAVNAIVAGACEVALTVGAEKMVYPHADKDAVFRTFLGGMDVTAVDATRELFKNMGSGTPPDDEGTNRTIFMDMYAATAREHMKQFGTTAEQIAHAAAKNHFHSTMNPLSQYQNDMSVEEVLADKPILWPLTRAMCAPVSDGAAAAILVSGDFARKKNLSRTVKVRASVLVSGRDRPVDDFSAHVGRRAAGLAYERSGLSPDDVDVVEVHDATSFGEILQVENLGLCGPGEGGPLTESGATTLGGKVPVNPSGGLVSKGHPIAATGIIQLHELVTQLRGEAEKRQVEGARVGAAENGGGFVGVEDAATTVTLLEASQP